ncbi:conserved hypothetical protein [Verticillium alfalfae VaMs.102]|uniref:MMS19 nucleotide excision repair protein n=1 Tax=Verticillium alfalfae (strain VaMs.102 / ATCC MYA-4576 / FGSC 10136) TaxID=526221 RepID=C9SMJ5_VERA1|nr:conserved hypothetical protein [Verticillium alfalfae VaMs.102]EEY20010.1 conserved hypothetical protein [Verticillium alfalfae VaMs.102]
MADFRKLALEFVLSDSVARKQEIAQESASVATLIHFFGNMFDFDVKAGVLPAAKALTHLSNMEGFQATDGDKIISSICTLKDDFKLQVSETRSVIYDLINVLISRPDVSNDLQYRYGSTSGFMTDLLQLCRNERDPKCLLTWFGILKTFLADYSAANELVEEVFNVFSAYFPISLRTSQHPSGITADDLKLALRGCFAAHYRLASLTIPYLVGRLDSGDSVTVNVKLDILKTIKACVDNYTHIQQGLVPYVDKIWTSLKYEVRNGEIEDTIKGTLEVIRTIAEKLTGNDLRDFALTVQRDCLDDLSNPTYATGSGKLLVAVHGAKPSAFAIMVSPTLTHVKENLRHTRSSEHTRSLLALSNALLRLRAALVDPSMTADDLQAFRSTEPAFVSLHREAYALPFHQATNPGAPKDVVSIGLEAIEGMGLLVIQPSASSGSKFGLMLREEAASEICSELSTFLFAAQHDAASESTSALVDQTLFALQKASIIFPPVFPKLVSDSSTVCRSAASRSPAELQATLHYILPKLAFTGCSEIPKSGEKTEHLVLLLGTFLKQLNSSFDSEATANVWVEYAIGVQAAMRYFRDACEASLGRTIKTELRQGNERQQNEDATREKADPHFSAERWVQYVSQRFPSLVTVQTQEALSELKSGDIETSAAEVAADQLIGDFLLISLFVIRQLYRRATAVVFPEDNMSASIALSSDFKEGSDEEKQNQDQYLQLLSDTAKFIVSQMDRSQQDALSLIEDVPSLFHSDDLIPQADGQTASYRELAQKEWIFDSSLSKTNPPKFPLSGLSDGRTIILSFGLLVPLQLPASIFDPSNDAGVTKGILYRILVAGLLFQDHAASPRSRAVVLAILTSLANNLNSQIELAINPRSDTKAGPPDYNRALVARPVFAAVAGILRKYKGGYLGKVIAGIIEGPADQKIGHGLARRVGLLFRDQECLQKEYNPKLFSPLWRQRAYVEIIKPMLAKAWGIGTNSQDNTIITANYSIAVLSATQWLDYTVYEEDADDLIRLIICVARNIGAGPDLEASLTVLLRICSCAPDKVKPFAKSVIRECSAVLEGKGESRTEEWMPAGFHQLDPTGRSSMQSRRLAVRLLGPCQPTVSGEICFLLHRRCVARWRGLLVIVCERLDVLRWRLGLRGTPLDKRLYTPSRRTLFA